MKINKKNMRTKMVILAGLLIVAFGVCISSATINVNATDIGKTYILWEWPVGLDLTDMYIDGNVMCGYETTDNLYLLTGLKPNELHNITVYTAGDSGTNTTRTLNATVSNVSGFSDSEEELPASPAIPLAGILIACLLLSWRHEHLSPAMPDDEIKENGDN